MIHREFAVGSGRADLMIEWKKSRFILELKIYNNPRTIIQGIEQLSKYLSRLNEQEGYLIIFDRRKEKTWEEKIVEREEMGTEGKNIFLFGM